MGKLLFWILVYTSALAFSQVLLKLGLIQIGSFSAKGFNDLLSLFLAVISNIYVVCGTILMASSFFLWLAILSWFKLSLAFPMTALGFVIVAILSYFMLNEKLFFHNYLGILFITLGIFLLLYKQA
jgi:uncharacterized membrane protein